MNGMGKGRERISSRLCAELGALHGARSYMPEIMTWAETKSLMFNWPYHPGAYQYNDCVLYMVLRSNNKVILGLKKKKPCVCSSTKILRILVVEENWLGGIAHRSGRVRTGNSLKMKVWHYCVYRLWRLNSFVIHGSLTMMVDMVVGKEHHPSGTTGLTPAQAGGLEHDLWELPKLEPCQPPPSTSLQWTSSSLPGKRDWAQRSDGLPLSLR